MPAPGIVIRIAAAVLALAVAVPAVQAKERSAVTAKVALGDKRSAKVRAAAKKKSARAAAPCANADVLPAADNLDLVRAALLCLHNQVRAERGLPALKDNARLRKAATGHTSAMIGEGFFEHNSPDGDSFVDRILAAGYAKRYDGWTLGENLAWGTGELATPSAIMAAWMGSPGHKANILKKAYREIGIGVRLGVPSDSGVGATVTADFGAKA